MRLLGPWMRRIAFAALVLPAALWLSGCLESQEAMLGRYDAEKDQFVFLNLYQRIAGQKPEDYDYLQTLWNNRDHLITPPLPGGLGKTSYLRLTGKTYYEINLGENPKSLDAQESPLPLDQVKVLPGQFFLRGPDALCYYDQVVIPGPFADAFVKVMTDKIGEGLATSAREELDRRKAGGKPMPWADLRRNFIDEVQHKSPAGGDANAANAEDQHKTDVIRALSEESLKRFLTAGADHSVALTRQKSVFTFLAPLADADVAEALGTIKALREAIVAEMKKPEHDKDQETQAMIVEVTEAKAVAGKGIQLSVDAVALFPRVQKLMDPLGELAAAADADAALRFKTAVETVRARGIPIDEKTTVQQVIADFGAGTLAAHPPQPSLRPGEGLKAKPDENK